MMFAHHCWMEFQFTHPGRGATAAKNWIASTEDEFQFTHPGRGATPWREHPNPCVRSFNSRTPGGVRLAKDYFTGVVPSVSIHAPREGCDRKKHKLYH